MFQSSEVWKALRTLPQTFYILSFTSKSDEQLLRFHEVLLMEIDQKNHK